MSEPEQIGDTRTAYEHMKDLYSGLDAVADKSNAREINFEDGRKIAVIETPPEGNFGGSYQILSFPPGVQPDYVRSGPNGSPRGFDFYAGISPDGLYGLQLPTEVDIDIEGEPLTSVEIKLSRNIDISNPGTSNPNRLQGVGKAVSRWLERNKTEGVYKPIRIGAQQVQPKPQSS